MPTSGFAVALMFVAFIGKSVATAGGPAAMALIAPGEIRGQSLAIYNSFIALVGPLFGPPLVGWMIDRTGDPKRSEEHTSELQSLMRISYAVFCLKKKKNNNT